MAEGFSRGGFKDDLPGIAATSALVEGRERWRELKRRVFLENGSGLLNFSEGGFFGFVGDGELREVSKRRQLAGAAVLEQVFGKSGKISSNGCLNDRMVGLIGLDNDVSDIKMSAPDPSYDLSKEFKSAFFGGKIW